VTLDNTDLVELPVSTKDTLGIEINQFRVPGVVSFYEEHEARLESGYSLPLWYNLDAEDRAVEVAMFRIKKAIEYQKYKAEEKASKRKQ
jgi:hypothetical protein